MELIVVNQNGIAVYWCPKCHKSIERKINADSN